MRLPAAIMATLVLALALAGCNSSADEKPGGVTKDEARALDAAAEMLDQREMPALPEATAPAQDAPQPSAS